MRSAVIKIQRQESLIEAGKVLLLFSAAVLFIDLRLPQLVTGTIVNCILVLAVESLGLYPAIILGLITPLTAVLNGVLPLPLLIMIPFISLANAVYLSCYQLLAGKNRLLAIVAAAAAKFLLLFSAVTFLVIKPLTLLVFNKPQVIEVPALVARMMSWPQLFTALVGGGMALLCLGWSKSHKKITGQ